MIRQTECGNCSPLGITVQCGIFIEGNIMEGLVLRGLNQQDSVDVPRLQVLARSSPEDEKFSWKL